MVAYFAFIAILAARLLSSALLDRGTRELILSRIAGMIEHDLQSLPYGPHIVDLRWISSSQRKPINYITLYGGGRIAVICLAAYAMLDIPDWLLQLAGAFTLFFIITGRDSRLIFEQYGVHKPYPIESWTQRLTIVAAYIVKAASMFVSLIVLGKGLIYFSTNALLGVFWMSVGLIGFSFSHILPQFIAQLGHTDGKSARGFGIDSKNDSVLFLRSFNDDNVKIWSPMTLSGAASPVLTLSYHRFEEFLARSLVPLNLQLVAIGRPGERLPKLGALRTYYPDDQWQQAVQTTAARSSAILLVAGRTDGLSWEIQHLKKWGVLGKALFILPPEPSKTIAHDRLVKLIDNLGFGHELPVEWDETKWLAVRLPKGELQYVVSDGRDWASYASVLFGYLLELRGTVANLEGVFVNPKTIGHERLSFKDRFSLYLILKRAASAQEEGDRSSMMDSIKRAESIAQNSGVEGAICIVNLLHSYLLIELGDIDQAWSKLEEVSEQAKRGFKRVITGIPQLGNHSAAELEVEAWEALADLSARFGKRGPRQIHIQYFDVLMNHRRFGRAGEVARLIADNSGNAIEGHFWFQRAVASASKVGDLPLVAVIELTWGDYLLTRELPRAALDHLETASGLFQSQANSELLDTTLELISKAKAALFEDPTLNMTAEAREWVDRAVFVARERNDLQVEPAHFILALERYPNFTKTLNVKYRFLPKLTIEAPPTPFRSPDHVVDGSEALVSLSKSTRQLLQDASTECPSGEPLNQSLLWIALMRLTLIENSDSSTAIDPTLFEDISSYLNDSKVQLPELEPVSANTPARSVGPLASLVALPLVNRPTAWGFTWPYVPTATDPYVRPAGLAAEEPMPFVTRWFVTARLLATVFLTTPSIRSSRLRSLRIHLQSRGYTGSAMVVGMIEADFLQNAGRFVEEELLIRDLLKQEMPGWVAFGTSSPHVDDQIKIGNAPKTSAEVRDELLSQLGINLGRQGKLSERIEVEKLRVQNSNMLRHPKAPQAIELSLAFALAKAGEHQAASERFKALEVADSFHDSHYLMVAANWLALGNLEEAQRLLVLAERERPVRFATDLGIKGDISLAAGDTEQALALYYEGLKHAIASLDTINHRLFKLRIASLNA